MNVVICIQHCEKPKLAASIKSSESSVQHPVVVGIKKSINQPEVSQAECVTEQILL